MKTIIIVKKTIRPSQVRLNCQLIAKCNDNVTKYSPIILDLNIDYKLGPEDRLRSPCPHHGEPIRGRAPADNVIVDY